ncbi:MAG TPA: hypothetical protein VMG30_05485 [Acidobacteriota bacterium]|nr:hypothetical protein [Acidobacteriota bacterium]
MKTKLVFIVALLLLSMNLMAGGPGKFIKTWKNPGAQPTNWKGKKVAAFVITIMRDAQQGAEQALAQELTQRGAQGVPGYTLVPFEERKDLEKVKRILQKAEISGAAVMSVVDLQHGVTIAAGGPYTSGLDSSTFWGYWGYNYGAMVTPTMIDPKTTVAIETRLYSIEQDLLCWQGTSEVVNPKDAATVIRQLTGKVGKEVKKAGLVSK